MESLPRKLLPQWQLFERMAAFSTLASSLLDPYDVRCHVSELRLLGLCGTRKVTLACSEYNRERIGQPRSQPFLETLKPTDQDLDSIALLPDFDCHRNPSAVISF